MPKLAAAWNASLAYAAADAVNLSAPGTGNAGGTVTVVLRAPLNMDVTKRESGTVTVMNSLTGEQTELTVTERSVDSDCFEGVLTLPNVPYVVVSYGSGIFRQTAEVTVSDFTGTSVTNLALGQSSLALSSGETRTLTVEVSPQDATDQRVKFVSEDTTVATVTDGGVVKAVNSGETRIVVSSLSNPMVTAVCTITVTAAAPQSLRVAAPGALSVFGAEGKAEVTGVIYSDGTVQTENLPAVTFSTEHSELLRVTPNGTLTALAAGEATIVASATVEGTIITGIAKVALTAEVTYDFLTLYRANEHTTNGVTTAIAANTADSLTASYGTRAENIKNFPLLVLHGSADPTVPVSGSREMVAALKTAGSTSVMLPLVNSLRELEIISLLQRQK